MARLARVVIPGLPHHVTQRGNGREQTFFSDRDYSSYLRVLRSATAASSVTCLAYCLMPNHVHLILVPCTRDGLRECLARTHRAYAGMLNTRRNRCGHFWQGRFGSVVMDDAHAYQALRYVLLNPVRAGLVDEAIAWRWSSAQAYLAHRPDGVTSAGRFLAEIPDMRAYLREAPHPDRVARIRAGETCGWPAAELEVLRQFETLTGRRLAPHRRGPLPLALRS